MNEQKINILGTTYTVYKLRTDQDKYLEKADGYCDKTSKNIVVKLEDEDNELEKYDVYLKTILRHEIIHAFMFESGLHESWAHPDHGHDETAVDWFAVQFPKILKVFQELDIL